MTEEDFSDSKKGLTVGTKAPIIDTIDIYGNQINLTKILKSYRGVVIDFFRGAW
jgi:hypothetical protein